MVDTTLIYEMKTEINPESSPEPESNPVKRTRGRPKKIKTPEEIEQDRIKHNEYFRNYYKERSAKDPEFLEHTRKLSREHKAKRFAENPELSEKNRLYQKERYKKIKEVLKLHPI